MTIHERALLLAIADLVLVLARHEPPDHVLIAERHVAAARRLVERDDGWPAITFNQIWAP